jgi:hypothetical protein
MTASDVTAHGGTKMVVPVDVVVVDNRAFCKIAFVVSRTAKNTAPEGILDNSVIVIPSIQPLNTSNGFVVVVVVVAAAAVIVVLLFVVVFVCNRTATVSNGYFTNVLTAATVAPVIKPDILSWKDDRFLDDDDDDVDVDDVDIVVDDDDDDDDDIDDTKCSGLDVVVAVGVIDNDDDDDDDTFDVTVDDLSSVSDAVIVSASASLF